LGTTTFRADTSFSTTLMANEHRSDSAARAPQRAPGSCGRVAGVAPKIRRPRSMQYARAKYLQVFGVPSSINFYEVQKNLRTKRKPGSRAGLDFA